MPCMTFLTSFLLVSGSIAGHEANRRNPGVHGA
eukprot:CAMPEP_0170174924 /NCGR_PEP_ID=MMETSP0040_2-20121228/8097_1 /TAXON_ID=641309 /ORGANISM="Lotharella oceanica, Strain CCMP622" /LENGTH=32 /DNA_ID= /DNA_START= /DNA_END= /DNA_ORIENTATION=